MSRDRAVWLALAHRALLHQASRGDALQSLALLRRHLADQQRPAAIGWLAADGQRVWIDGVAPEPSPALYAVWAGAPAQCNDGRWWLPLHHLSARVGVLCLAAADGDDLHDFEPLCEAAAALAAACNSRPDDAVGDGKLLRTALRGAGTFVWQWRPGHDELPDIDEGFEMLGYPADHFAPTQANWNRLIHPDDLDDNHAAYLRHERGQAEQYEHVYRARGADGRWHWVHERGRIVERGPDGAPRRVLGTQSDITQQRELEIQAQADRARLALIARHVPGMLYQFVQSADAAHARFVYVSERCEALFGLSAEALMADANLLVRRTHPTWRERLRTSLAAAAERGVQWRLEFPIRRTDGADRWMLGAATPQRLNQAGSDGSTTWFGYVADVSDRREFEAASRERAAAQAASQAKTEFLSRMSHELRTPLNAVLGFAQLLELSRTPPLADAHRRPVQLIRQAGDHLLTMIGDLLDLTRIEAGQLRLQIEAVALAPLAEECLAMLQTQAESARVSVVAELQDASAVRSDRTRLKQVLLNLLSNAIKYNRAGGTVTLRTRSNGPQAVIEVADSGVGIAPEHLARLFEPFQRGAHGHSAIEGTGIGLAVSRSLIEVMGGRIDVQSALGQGSLFTLLLPQS